MFSVPRIRPSSRTFLRKVLRGQLENRTASILLPAAASALDAGSSAGHRERSVSSVAAAAKEIFDDLRRSAPLKRVVEDGQSQATLVGGRDDPFSLVRRELDNLTEQIKQIVASDHPVLSTVASYFVKFSGKRMRPAIVLLLARATSADEKITASQMQLAGICETIHIASIVHDDVLDEAETRRGSPSANRHFGNKTAVLAGDFLLARASIALSRLHSFEVIELLSTVIEHLVQGEIMQMKAPMSSSSHTFDYYVDKTYYKTASLIARSCQAAAILGGHPVHVQELSYDFGKHLGLAYQFIDDLLDFTGTSKTLGKPALSDLRQGLATAPVLYAQEEFPELTPLIQRQFREPGDVERATELVYKSKGLERTRQLAALHSSLASQALDSLPPTESRLALQALLERILVRDR
eukprot:tig00020614_g12220.t1